MSATSQDAFAEESIAYAEANGFRQLLGEYGERLADFLAIEYFLLPGALTVIDGRTMNARFLRNHFKCNWRYWLDMDDDVHLFEFIKSPIGSRNQLRFCLGESWLKDGEEFV